MYVYCILYIVHLTRCWPLVAKRRLFCGARFQSKRAKTAPERLYRLPPFFIRPNNELSPPVKVALLTYENSGDESGKRRIFTRVHCIVFRSCDSGNFMTSWLTLVDIIRQRTQSKRRLSYS